MLPQEENAVSVTEVHILCQWHPHLIQVPAVMDSVLPVFRMLQTVHLHYPDRADKSVLRLPHMLYVHS